MKRKLAIALVAVMTGMLALTGCGSKNEITTEYIKLAGYKGIEVPAVEKPAEITEKDVMVEVQAALDQNSVAKEVVDRPVEMGDTVNIDFVGTMNGEKFEGGSAEGYPLEIGSGSFIDGFEDSIIGHEIGDTFDWNGKFPENYKEDLAGKDVTFTITVNGITVYEKAELTDEFVQTVSTTAKTVDEYKEEIKKELEASAEETYRINLEDAVCNAVIEKAEILAYPEGEVEAVVDSYRAQYESYAAAYGMTYEDIIIAQGYELESFEAEIRAAAENRVAFTLIVEAIAEAEGLEPSDKEYEEAFEEMLALYGYADVNALMEAAGGEDALKAIVLQEAVITWLADNCIQVNE